MEHAPNREQVKIKRDLLVIFFARGKRRASVVREAARNLSPEENKYRYGEATPVFEIPGGATARYNLSTGR